MTVLSIFGFLCLYVDITINQKDLLTFPTFIGYALLGALLIVLLVKHKIGKKHRIVITGLCFVYFLLKSLQDTFHFFDSFPTLVSVALWLLQIAACFLVSWMVYKSALEYAKSIRKNVVENKAAVILTLSLIAFLSLVSWFFSLLWEYSAYIITGLKLLLALALIREVNKLLKVKKDDVKTV